MALFDNEPLHLFVYGLAVSMVPEAEKVTYFIERREESIVAEMGGGYKAYMMMMVDIEIQAAVADIGRKQIQIHSKLTSAA